MIGIFLAAMVGASEAAVGAPEADHGHLAVVLWVDL
jgi:hypothetical protein